ncbi:MAG: hypothetical protein C0176_00635 [Mesoaciditoga sp.]|uniref:YaaR family protein n=1 Tax=Athalassotoga sp. TaxID=2022597 RepID=UPI000CAD5A9E|nr:MAG: hypothetical protein C0185_01680 [Mesoaciditoga sp.]PMP80852.1 MAG: hypothetical protein C0176_00635 [Mesoaciditoga sp.]HEU24146.1 DUF327 family protein [Mesoaciditoga lauensis]
MRINPADEGAQPVESKRSKDVKKLKNESFGYFLDEEEEKDLNIIIEEIIESGNALSRSPTEENMNVYKKKIRAFLVVIKNHLYRFSEVKNFEDKKTRFYFIVDEIDKKLEELSKKIIESEKSTIYFASKIGEINGLIMDLYR